MCGVTSKVIDPRRGAVEWARGGSFPVVHLSASRTLRLKGYATRKRVPRPADGDASNAQWSHKTASRPRGESRGIPEGSRLTLPSGERKGREGKAVEDVGEVMPKARPLPCRWGMEVEAVERLARRLARSSQRLGHCLANGESREKVMVV